MKIMKKMSCALLLAGIFSGQSAFAMGLQEWPVADKIVRTALVGVSKQFENQAEIYEQMSKMQENNATSQNISRTAVEIMNGAQRKVITDSTPTLAACQILTRKMGGGAPVGKSMTAFKEMSSKQQNGLVTTGAERPSSVKNRKDLKTCTELDVQNGIGGCTKEDLKDPDNALYAGATENVNSILADLGTGSLTINEKQIPIAEAFIQNLGSWIPDSSVAGKNNAEYTREINEAKSSVSTAQHMLSKVLADAYPLPMDTKSAEGLSWFTETNRKNYEGWFGATMPQKPSLLDRTRTRMYNDAYNPASSQDLSAGEVEQNRVIIETLRQNNVLMVKLVEQQRDLITTQAMALNELAKIKMALKDPTKLSSSGR